MCKLQEHNVANGSVYTVEEIGKKYAVVYYYTDENGVQRQKWEPPVDTKKEA